MTKTATKTEVRVLACHLAEHELVERGTELVENYKKIADLDMQKKRIAARIKPLDERIEQLVTIIDTKTEERQVKCYWAYTWSEGIKRLFREDTYDIVCEEVIKEWERQQSLGIIEEVECEVVCPKCEGDGVYYEDGIEDGGGEVFCDCPAGIKAKEENEPTDPTCKICHSAHPDCGACCNTCEDICNLQQFCMIEEREEEKRQEEAAENDRRAAICQTWQECEHKDICFLPQNEIKGVCFKDEPHRIPSTIPTFTFQDLMNWGYNRNESKIIASGFQLVKYDREAKTIHTTNADPRGGWVLHSDPFDTYAAAERVLDSYISESLINVAGNLKGTVNDHKCTKTLRAAGFEFYRSEGIIPGHGTPRIKYGDSWRTWKKFDTAEECATAWKNCYQAIRLLWRINHNVQTQ